MYNEQAEGKWFLQPILKNSRKSFRVKDDCWQKRTSSTRPEFNKRKLLEGFTELSEGVVNKDLNRIYS